jgi:alpha-1,2-rhamnosyltransferase
MQRGLPVMASDIPVFHEIGGEFVSYFDLSEPASLARQVRQSEDSGIFPAARQISGWSWLSWEDSARQLVKRVVRQVRTQKQSEPHEIEHCPE